MSSKSAGLVKHSGQKRVTFMIHSLRQGGAERVVATLANHFSRIGLGVDIILLDSEKGATPAYSLDPRIRIHVSPQRQPAQSGIVARVFDFLTRVYQLRQILKSGNNGDVIAFTRDINVLSILASRGLKSRIIISERNHPNRFARQSRLRRLVVRVTYPLADWLIVQTQEIARHYAWRDNVRVIPNPVDLLDASTSRAPGKTPKIVAVGRLVEQKGFDRLLSAIGNLRKKGVPCELVIYGEGPERVSLTRQAESFGLPPTVLHGPVKNIFANLVQHDIFVLSSRFEGFPNVLLEAMAAGLAPVAFDCPSGPRELITDGVDGLLVPEGNIPALEDAITKLLLNPDIRVKIAQSARLRAKQFSIEGIANAWLEIMG